MRAVNVIQLQAPLTDRKLYVETVKTCVSLERLLSGGQDLSTTYDEYQTKPRLYHTRLITEWCMQL